MSGLLSKATAAEEATQPEPVEQEVKAEAGLLGAGNSSDDGPDMSTILTSVGWAVIVVGGLLSLQGGQFTPLVASCALLGCGLAWLLS